MREIQASLMTNIILKVLLPSQQRRAVRATKESSRVPVANPKSTSNPLTVALTLEKVTTYPASQTYLQSCKRSKVQHISTPFCTMLTVTHLCVDRVLTSCSRTSAFKIRIPVLNDKRKCPENPLQLSEAEESESPPKKKKAKKSKKGVDSASKTQGRPPKKVLEGEGELPVIAPKRPRGRPKATRIDSAKRDFLVPVYLEIAQDAVLTRGKTPKGDKWVKQPPRTDGPFELTRKMTWEKFTAEVAEIAHIGKENFGSICEDMKWSFQKKSPLPLKDEQGFKTLMSQIKGMKDPDSAIIIVTLPPIVNRRLSERKVSNPEANLFNDVPRDDGTLYGKKVSFSQVYKSFELVNKLGL